MTKYKLPFIFILLSALVSCSQTDQTAWKIADNPLLTEWSDDVDPAKPWPEYPRPAMVRDTWLNMNGLWDYAITQKDREPESWDGKILVPYPLESALSGVKKRISEDECLWYRTDFKVPGMWKNKRILLNFEACDWETIIWIDGKKAGEHRGAYDPFCFDITDYVRAGKKHELRVSVWDPASEGRQPRGKQVTDPHGIWYTPSTGIWQTVWMEPVDNIYLRSFRSLTDIEKGTIKILPEIVNLQNGVKTRVKILKDNILLAETEAPGDKEINIRLEDFDLWSPGNPVLYDIEIELFNNGKVSDRVTAYTGFRRIAIGKAEDNYTRMLLNNSFVFQNGPLDQGFWPDGLYTPPTDDAMRYDLEMIKKMGFNMLRKHVKVENRRFYYWCDIIGLLVWQDMPNGDKHIGGNDDDIIRSEESARQFELELSRLIETKYNYPSIIVWVAFNEGWGQYETGRITDLIKELDPTRLVNSASGWTDRGTGDILDIHHYPDPRCPEAEENRAIVLGEFGGLGLPVENHTWEEKNWAYENMDDAGSLLSKYREFYDTVYRMVKEEGLSASIYTQITDVETETNGLLTYDRRIDKMGADNLRKINTGEKF
ncbi:MAG: glycoside hydrolase family 2 TIM barrel-domain containing protein [Bacteroidales bacterium]|nr:glycoside hydrolase family 2 TIM barrel-domain containing protein [Bacteroidales bacterium]